MKKFITAVFALALAFTFAQSAFAQQSSPDEPKTLFGSEPFKHGGYGALVTKISQVDGEVAYMAGAKGAWLVNGTFSLGIGGYGLTSRHLYDNVAFTSENWFNGVPDTIRRTGRLEMSWGGLQIGYINNPNDIIHLTGSVLIGGGVAAFTTRTSHMDWDDDDWDNWEHKGAGFYAVEPEIGLEINVVKFMRVEFQAGYRQVWGLELEKVNDKKLSGPTGSLSLKFGKF
ncbi:MAG: hypothetical protein ACM3U1_01330 [Chloroflexota bacterium]